MKNNKSGIAELVIIPVIVILGIVGYFFVVKPITKAHKTVTQSVATVKADLKAVGDKLTPSAPVADEVADEPAQEGLWVSIKSILTVLGVAAIIVGVALAIGAFFKVFNCPYPTAASLVALGTVVLGGLSILTFLGWLSVGVVAVWIGLALWHWIERHQVTVNSDLALIESDAKKLWSEICFLWGKIKASVKTLFQKKPVATPTTPVTPAQ